MEIVTAVRTTRTIELSEAEIVNIIRDSLAATHGEEWRAASCAIIQRESPVVMGQIDDRYDTVAKLQIVDERNG